MLRHARTAALLISLTSTSLLLAQKPNPKAIVAKVDHATKAVKKVSYVARAWGEGAMNDMPRVRAVVKARANADDRLDAMSVKGTYVSGNKTFPFHMVVNGDDVLVVEETSRKCVTGKLPEADALVAQSRQTLLMIEFVHPQPFNDELSADSLTYEGRKVIGGVPCDVIYVVYKNAQGESRWYFGVDDHLPHRVDRVLRSGGERATRVLELSDLNTSPKFDDRTFATTPPTGYEAVAYQSRTSPPRRTSLLPIGSEAPTWTLSEAGGKSVTLNQERGNVVVLFFWASWSKQCRRVLPGIQKLQERFAGRPVRVLGISTWEKRNADPAGRARKSGCTVPLLLNGDKIANAYNLNGLPTFFVIDKNGRIVFADVGAAATDKLADVVESALKK